MTIVNPYLKKKPTTDSTNRATATKTQAVDAKPSKPSPSIITTTTPAKAIQTGNVQARTNVVTPQTKAVSRTTGTTGSGALSPPSSTGSIVTPSMRSLSTQSTALPQQLPQQQQLQQQRQKLPTTAVVQQTPSTRPPPLKTENKPLQSSGGASTSRRDQAIPGTTVASAPKKMTLKQKLKQEISALRKQKQLIQMQKEAQERRRLTELERAAKEEERQRLMQARQAEHQARLEEKMRRRQEKQDAMERKRLERLAQQQAAAAKQEQEQRDYQQALAQYNRELEDYRCRHAQWLQERRRWMQASQQQYTLPLFSQSIPSIPMFGYPQLPPVLPWMGISGGIQRSLAHANKQDTDGMSKLSLPSAPSQFDSTFAVTVNDGVPTSLLPSQDHSTHVNSSDGTQTNATSQCSESDSQSLLPANQSALSHSVASASPCNDTIQSIPVNPNKQRSDTDSQSILPSTHTQSNTFSSPHTTTPTIIPSFPPIHPGWITPYHTGAMAPYAASCTSSSNTPSASFMHYMARDQSSFLAPSYPFLPPQMTQSSFYTGPQNVSQAVANMTYLMSLMPSHLKAPPRPPVPPRKPKGCITKKKPEVVEQPLGAVMEAPSPYAATHVLLNVMLIRSLDQPSYGVNLKALTTTVLVDAPKREQKEPVFVHSPPNDTGNQHTPASIPDTQRSHQLLGDGASIDSNDLEGVMQSESSCHVLNEGTNNVREAHGDLNSSDATSKTTIESTFATRHDQDDTGAKVATAAFVEDGLPSMAEESALTCHSSAQNDSASIIESQNQDKTSFPSLSEVPVATTTLNATASEVKTTLPRKPRRRRINFTVMMVVDAEKQNTRWQELRQPAHESMDANKEPPTLLEPGDIIVSIGGKDVAGCSFSDACAIFAETSVQTTTPNTNGDRHTEIQAKLVIARKRQIPTKAKSEKAAIIKSESNVNSNTNNLSNADSQTLGTGNKLDDVLSRPFLNAKTLSSPANASLSFSIVEIAVLADGVIQAIHDQPTSRLLGQEISAAVLANKTTIFRRVASLKDCILSHRNPETLFAKWSQLCQSMSTSLAEQSRAAWNRQALLVEASNELSSLSYSSDAERTALRQLPRPTKGCRCQRQDHDYLHDVRCTLYKDICRLVPPEELQELQHDPNRIQKSKSNAIPKDLNAVETAFKDRLVKLKTTAEMEEAEARFVARMEEVQVTQLRKAVFAPNLTSMVLSSIMDLQREFPDAVGPSLESDDGESDDENLDDELLLSGKRKTSRSNKESKKTKVNQVKSINFKYLTRIVQHIGKTWGHVYKEPSHEDYAWRWELFHGHNTEGIPWNSQSTNPRNPNSLSFEYLGNGLEILDKNSAQNLAKASDAIADFEDALQTDLLKQMTPPEAQIESQSKSNATDLSSKVDAMDVDQTMPDTSTDPTTVEVKDTKKSDARLELSDKVVEQLCLAAYLLSPSSSGFYDEILALVHMGVIDISRRGIPFLPEDWASKVDFVVLEDMDATWGSDSDPDGRCCINLDFRDSLEQEWIKTNRGWALSSDPDDTIYALDVMEEWRDFFQGQVEEKANISEGIGRFGL